MVHFKNTKKCVQITVCVSTHTFRNVTGTKQMLMGFPNRVMIHHLISDQWLSIHEDFYGLFVEFRNEQRAGAIAFLKQMIRF